MDAKAIAEAIREQLGRGFFFMVGRVTGLETRVPRIIGA